MAVEGPDSGYSWVIVLCCAYIHFALFGLFRSAGVVYVAILQNYDVSREEAAWAFALCAAVFQLVGPVASVLTHYMSQRKACLLGSAIATLGIVGCYFADSVMWINICYGVIHGMGFGFVVTFVPVFLNQYFVKYRATAMGIAFAGGSISSLLFPVVMEWLLENYTLNDSFLLLSGVVMNSLVAAALLRSPSWLKTSQNTSEKLAEHSEARDSGVSTCDDLNGDHKGQIQAVYAVEEKPRISEMSGNNIDKINVPPREVSDEDYSQKNDSVGTENASNRSNFDTLRSNNDSVLFDGASAKEDCDPVFKKYELDEKEPEVKEPLMKMKEISIVPQNKVDQGERKSRSQRSISYVLKQPMFHLLTFTMAVYFLGVHSVFMVIVDFAKDKGIPESKGIYIISMFSLTDLFGRACLGWVTDRNVLSRKTMIGLNLGVLGVMYQLYPLTDSLAGILSLAAITGLAVGSSITLFFVLQAECLGMKSLTLVVGMTSFINGVLSFIRPGIIGLFRDVIGSYNWMFHFYGSITLLFSAVWLFQAWTARRIQLQSLKV